MRWSIAGLDPRSRRALAIGAVAVALYSLALGGRLYSTRLADARADLDRQRVLLSQELGLVRAADEIEGRVQASAALFAERSDAMFTANDSLAAVSELSSRLQDLARAASVLIEHVAGRSSSVENEGVVTLMVVLRGRTDLEGLTTLIRSVENEPRLVRLDQLSINRLAVGDASDSASPPADVQVLEFSALFTGYALPPEPAGADPERSGGSS